MKALVIAVGLLTPAAFAVGRATAPAPKPSAATLADLGTAMHGEAFAFAKYNLFAQAARAHGNNELASKFEDAARTERFEHFSEEAALAGTVGSDAENLRDAIKGESYEVDTMYPEFARKAAAAGDQAAAQRFGEIRKDEVKHRDLFQAELDKLTKAQPAGIQ